MPLITNNILQAKAAYSGLELRMEASQLNVATLQATVDHLSSIHADLIDSVRLQSEFTAAQVVANGTLTANQATAVSPDLTLDNFIAALGLSIALAESTMPDRSIGSVSATVQSFLTFAPGPDGKTPVPGLRLYQPELGASTALATTSFDLAKTAPAPGSAAPRSLYTVLQTMQSIFADPFWSKFTAGTPPAAPAQQIVAETVKVFSMIGGWSFPYLLQEATTFAALETTLAGLVAGNSTRGPATAFVAAAASLTALTQALAARTQHVAGDLFALTSALDSTANLAGAVMAGSGA